MSYSDPALTWQEWFNANQDQDETTKLLALHEYIVATARTFVSSGDITADWANKKLAKLGITDRISHRKAYALSADITAKVVLERRAGSRVEALEQAFKEFDGTGRARAIEVKIVGTPVFTHGPEDPNPDVVDPDAPTTVTATLEKLREVLMLGNVSGPRWNCDTGTNKVLASYGLALLPATAEYVVTRPAQVTMRTVVRAYDEGSAMHVAGWRWEDGRSGYAVAEVTGADAPSVELNG